MNCRINESSLRGVCRELLRGGRPVSHRDLRQVLRERFGATGKTARVLRIWREESERVAAAIRPDVPPENVRMLPVDVRELQQRLIQAETQAGVLRVRAELAELREQSHQERWALEIDRLREELRAHPNYAREVTTLQSTVMRLTVELAALRGAMADASSD
jgi:hypothetical protein